MLEKREWKFKDEFEFSEVGPWTTEPDKVQFIDETTGYDCLIVRGTAGALCGYVGVPDTHPLFEIHYSEYEDYSPLNVHGGVTFTDFCSEFDKERGICHEPPCSEEHVWWVGFDCAHAGDFVPSHPMASVFVAFDKYGGYKDIEYVTKQVLSLAKQLKDMV